MSHTCKFCHQSIGEIKDHMEGFFCDPCSMIYVYENNKLFGYGFILKHRNVEYRMTFSYNTHGNYFRIFMNDGGQENVLTLDFHPENITPQNALSKLKSFLAFL